MFLKNKGSWKKFQWTPCLWVGRRLEPILGYISKFDGKKFQAVMGLVVSDKFTLELFVTLVNILLAFLDYLPMLTFYKDSPLNNICSHNSIMQE